MWLSRSSSLGVPQEAVLFPFLFTILVNSAPSVLHHAKLIIFANDIKLFLCINSISDCHLLQQNLNNLVVWSESFSLSLNISKCSVFSLHHSQNQPNSIYHSPHDYTPVLNSVNIFFLADRRHAFNFLSRSTRSISFHTPRSFSNFLDNFPITHLMHAANNDPDFSL